MMEILSIPGNQAAERKLIVSGMAASRETSHRAWPIEYPQNGRAGMKTTTELRARTLSGVITSSILTPLSKSIFLVQSMCHTHILIPCALSIGHAGHGTLTDTSSRTDKKFLLWALALVARLAAFQTSN